MDKSKAIIKVGMLVSYDWQLLKKSIPRIYQSADIICLALDKNRLTWSCNSFNFDENEFKSWIKSIDTDQKIEIYEDSFCDTNLNARENGNKHRKMLSEFMGEGGWHIQIDADEYFLDFDAFCKYLLKFDANPKLFNKSINICVNFIPLFKQTDNGYLHIDFDDGNYEKIPLATNHPQFIRARQNNHFNHITNFFIVHETWARGEEELSYKLKNWGHSAEELKQKTYTDSYLSLWKSLDEYNYQYLRNFHPAKPKVWPKLKFTKGKDIDELIQNMSSENYYNISGVKLFYFNNRNIARLRFYLDKYFKK